jgi:hypothetical protein
MKRDRHLAGQMNKDYGHLSGHYNQLQKQDAAIRAQTRADMQKNGGYLTKAQQKQINGEENALRSEISADKGPPPKTQFEQNHPRRAEVLYRDNRIGGRLNADAGKLGGNYGSLKQQRSKHSDAPPAKLELARSTEEEKQSQLKRLSEFHARNAKAAPAALERLKRTVIENGNVFAELMNTVRVCSLGQITKALFEVGGEYRRSM